MCRIRPKGDKDVAGSQFAKGVEQAMQSSAMVALRTMMMIVCLVAVPLAAVFGTALPKAVKSAFGYHEAWQPSKLAEDEQPPRVDSLALAADNDPQISQPAPDATIQPQAEPRESPILPHAKITGVRALPDVPTTAAAEKPDEPMIETAPLWNPAPRTASTPRNRQMTTHLVPAPAPHRDILRQGRPRFSATPSSVAGRTGVTNRCKRRSIHLPTRLKLFRTPMTASCRSSAWQTMAPWPTVSGVAPSWARRTTDWRCGATKVTSIAVLAVCPLVRVAGPCVISRRSSLPPPKPSTW